MKSIRIGNHDVELYESIDELPITRFHKFNKYLLVDAGIGSEISDWDAHVERTVRYIRSNPDLAIKELENLRQNVHFIQNELSPKHLAFCVLVKSVDGRCFEDASDAEIEVIRTLLQEITSSELTANLESVKKKIDDDLQLYFPKLFDDPNTKEYYDLLRRRGLLMLDQIIDKQNRQDEIDRLTDQILTFAPPRVFSGSNGVEVQTDRDFESMCLLIAQQTHTDPKRFTVLEYYNAFEYVKDNLKRKNKK